MARIAAALAASLFVGAAWPALMQLGCLRRVVVKACRHRLASIAAALAASLFVGAARPALAVAALAAFGVSLSQHVGAVWPALLQPWLPRCSLAPIDLLGCDHGRADVHHDVETASRTPLGVRAAEEEYHRRGSGEMLDDIALPVFAFGYRYES